GNGAYTGITRLNNPVNDAADVSATLRGLGFTVDTLTNAGRVQMEEAVTRLKNRLAASRGSYGFFFYAGHGVQSGGENYLLPVDANIPGEAYLRDRAVPMQAVLGELNDAGNALNIVVLDACRDNPFGWGRSGSRGLQVVSNQPADSIIVYATSAGSVAQDGTGRNGLFTTHLLNNLKIPGLSVRDLFDKTGADVRRASGGSQIPAVYS
ncbi:MAG: caspase family protein, partial [Treponema sp.]|nr:caspase family protein [Treponema sp.]